MVQKEGMVLSNYIERNEAKCFGMPSLIGRRLTVFNIVSFISVNGLDVTLKDYDITMDQARSALQYCSGMECKTAAENFQFCEGCVLRTMADGETFMREDCFEVSHGDGTKTTLSNDKNFIFSGSLDDLEREEKGIEMWKLATKLLET